MKPHIPASNPVDAQVSAMAKRSTSYFTCDIEGNVASLTRDRLAHKNRLNFALYAERYDLFRAQNTAPDVQAVVQTSTHEAFKAQQPPVFKRN